MVELLWFKVGHQFSSVYGSGAQWTLENANK